MTATALDCAAFPRGARIVAVLLTLLLAVAGAMASTELRQAQWTATGLALLAAAWLCIAWMGYWILHSRTRLDGDTLLQTWIWDKRCRVQDVAQLKLVHWRWVDGIVAPRLLVRQRGGAVLWIDAADARLLRQFCEQVGRQQTQATLPERP